MIRHARKKDLCHILDLNNKESQWVGEETMGFFESFLDLANFLVIDSPQGEIIGFILTMEPTANYDSKNFLWFKERYKDFLYIDRIVIDPLWRSRGLATTLYKHLLIVQQKILVCEVSINPRNNGSIVFHNKFGFKDVGTFSSDGKKLNKMFLFDRSCFYRHNCI